MVYTADNLKVIVEAEIKQAQLQNEVNSKIKNTKASINVDANVDTSKYSKQIVQYYKDLEKQQDSFNKTNLNGIDYDIQKRQEASAVFSRQIQTQMQSEMQLQSQKDSFNKTNLSAIDYEIQKRQEESTTFSAQIKSQMQAEIQAQKEIESTQNKAITGDTLTTNIQRAQQNILNLKTKYSAFVDDPALLNKWQDLFDTSKIVTSQKELTNLNAKVRSFTSELEGAGKAEKSFGDVLTNDIKKFAEWMISATAFMTVLNGIQQIITNVENLDKAFTTLRITTGDSIESTRELLQSYTDLGEQIGATTTEVSDAAVDWLNKIGHNKLF